MQTTVAYGMMHALHIYVPQMSQQEMLDSLENDLKETEFNGKQKPQMNNFCHLIAS